MKCPVCSEATNEPHCMCGYSFQDDEIVDLQRLRTKAQSVTPWAAWVRLVQAVTHFQKRKGISGRQTAKALDMSPSQHHRTVALADDIDRYPQLALCRNEDAARRKLRLLRNISPNGETVSSEDDAFDLEEGLQKYLLQHWDETSLGKDWKLHKEGHVNAGEIGIIDLLGQHRHQSSWLVVELKVLKTSDEVLGQVLRYMGWVKQHLAGENDTVEGLIIASGADRKTRYGLRCLSNVRMMCYRLRDDTLELYEPPSLDFANALAAIPRLDPSQRVELLQQLEQLAAARGEE